MEEKNLQPSFALSKLFKIRKSYEYNSLNNLKKRINGTYIIIDYRYNENIKMPRLGITISSKLGNAYLRNKFKRLIREIFRLNKNNLSKNLEINILAKLLKKDFNYHEIEKDFLNLISMIK